MTAIYAFGPFRLDVAAGILFRGADPVALGQRAIALLQILVEGGGSPISKDRLIESAWPGLAIEESNLAVQIAALRPVFAEKPGGDSWIETLPRRGYRYVGPAANVVAFYNKRGTCEQWIKEGKGAIRWTRLSCRSFAANAVRLQLHALAYNLGNFLRTLATPEPIKDWSLTSLKEKLIKIGAKVVSHGRYVAFQMAEVDIPRHLFADILQLIAELRPPPITSTA